MYWQNLNLEMVSLKNLWDGCSPDEGMGVRKSVAHVEKTVPAVAPDKSYIMFKISVHNEEGLKELYLSGNNPIAKPIWDECIESIQVWELSPVEL